MKLIMIILNNYGNGSDTSEIRVMAIDGNEDRDDVIGLMLI